MQHEEKNESKAITIAGVLCARDGILSPTSASEICMEMSTNKEAFLSAYIQQFPKAANLPPDMVWWGAEVVCRTGDGKSKRLDLLGYSEKTTLVYAVEVQAGKGRRRSYQSGRFSTPRTLSGGWRRLWRRPRAGKAAL